MSLVSRITSFVEAVGLDIKALRSGKAETIHTHSIEDVSALGAALAGAGSNSNVDGGVPDTVYGGITSVDGGKPSTVF